MTVYEKQDADTSFLRTELGTVVTADDPVQTITKAVGRTNGQLFIVGDFAVESAIDAGIEPDIAIIDHMCEREPYQPEIELPDHTRYSAPNRAGQISDEAYSIVGQAMENRPALIEIEGEEDLLGLAIIDHSPTGHHLLFGAPGIDGPAGVKHVTITDELKQTVTAMFDRS
ncbi:MAG: GTP-dependent dephospho-CoA kinase family protein [Candidatus Nanohaloarchaeota archaeon QJJ-5]|nr:GTP-dependent dephospho-CoA kinase family protein [Candidatus Nanohaloarchaeota archaeon QJJ-5]